MIEILKWFETFESADTRKRQRLGWFLTPSGSDSKGFRKLMRLGRDGVTALGFFNALCQAMATMPIANRKAGTFMNSDGTLMDFEDILEFSRLGGMEAAEYRQITSTLAAHGWIALHKSLEDQGFAVNLPVTCHQSAALIPALCKEKEKEKEKDMEKNKAVAIAPVLPFDSEEFSAAWKGWLQYNSEKRKKMPPTTIKAQLKDLAKWGELGAILAIDTSIKNNWQGLFEPKQTSQTKMEGRGW
jgi:hypothetical protein